MVQGVSKGFEVKLELFGVGYRAQMKGSDFECSPVSIVVESPRGTVHP